MRKHRNDFLQAMQVSRKPLKLLGIHPVSLQRSDSVIAKRVCRGCAMFKMPCFGACQGWNLLAEAVSDSRFHVLKPL
jgi:hypothetical protein